MDDRTLLERAAKAAGLQLDYTIRPDDKAFYHSDRNALALADGGWFAPLNDDGDALRLAVARRFTVAVRPHEIEVFSEESGECLASIHTEGRDPLQATRYAITSAAAAEIGGE